MNLGHDKDNYRINPCGKTSCDNPWCIYCNKLLYLAFAILMISLILTWKF